MPTSINPTQIPSSTELSYTPGRGAEQWNQWTLPVDIPVQGGGFTGVDAYYRFQWYLLDTGTTSSSYNWSVFDTQINDAISKGQKFSFGIMPLCPGCGANSIAGHDLHYPVWLHNLMQGEATPDWVTTNSGSNDWIPNWNSNNYLTAIEQLCIDVNNHLNNTSFNGIVYASIINAIDIRGFGSFGEWHSAFIVNTMADYPTGTAPTIATYKRIVDAHKNGFPNFQLQLMIAIFDGNYLLNTMIDPTVGVYALQSSNNVGLFGWRRDSWGDTIDTYLDAYLENNTRGVPAMNTLIMPRYKVAPITGEPNNQATYTGFPAQVPFYGLSRFGNGNNGFTPGANTPSDNFRAASLAAGYRITITSGSINGKILTLNWSNLGNAPNYENWVATIQLRTGSTVVYQQVSSFNPKLFLPGTTTTTDTLTAAPRSSAIAPATHIGATYALALSVLLPDILKNNHILPPLHAIGV